ncbi:hypothetical protein PDE_01890 [Penicillium oxalicum 114-2]|uniref:F-box domain-containing protein n=1 Tax=Penicillium oxalicum (strain 114-2 / CGMCC 5302) TaxID=933388 RepID=S7Z8N9_PENO1|nr:hypothetical protein PDE_01890 [Penicillium oxalicum 114-2]
MTQRLDSCPTEILQLIFNILSPTDYRSLCLVNHNLRAQAEPFLYSQIQWVWQEAQTPPPIIKLLRSVTVRPHLASYIKSISLDGKSFCNGIYSKRIPTLVDLESETQIEELTAFVRNTHLPYADRWIRDLVKGTIDAFVALLVAQSSNIQSLSLGPAFTQRSEIIGMVLRTALCSSVETNLPTFPLLEDVSFHLRYREDRARGNKIKNTADVLPLFYLPALRRLSVSIESSPAFSWPTLHPPLTTNLTELDLTRVRENCLGGVLAATKNLRSLRWKWYYDFGLDDEVNKPIIDLDQIGAALSHVGATLTDLCIVADFDIGGNDQCLPGIKAEGSIHKILNLVNVRKVQIPWAFLVGFVQDTSKRLIEVIPRNIEYLIITNDLRLQNYDGMEPSWPEWDWTDEAIVALLESWLRGWKECMPNLRGISLEWMDEGFEEWDPHMRQRLREVGAHFGVPLDLVVIRSAYAA